MSCSILLARISSPRLLEDIAAGTMLDAIIMCVETPVHPGGTHFGTAHYGEDKYDVDA